MTEYCQEKANIACWDQLRNKQRLSLAYPTPKSSVEKLANQIQIRLLLRGKLI